MFKPKYLKQAKLLQKGVRKFLHYKEDIMPAEKREEIEAKLDDFGKAVAEKDKEVIKERAKTLTKACERAVPSASNPGLRENLEVIFVAVIIAVGIRAYFLQPFRIPTGSMQPTLNGVIGFPHDPSTGDFEAPGFVGKAFDKVAQGRTYVDFTIPAGAVIENISEKTKFKFFHSTTFEFKDPAMPSVTVGVPKAALLGNDRGSDIGLAKTLGLKFSDSIGPDGRRKTGMRHQPITEDLKVQGYIDTGDQVLVNKFSYHFRTPNRGEVFVFSTHGIDYIQGANPPEGGRHSQHYIKRLCGLPEDVIEIREQNGPLYVNGELATEEGIVRVGNDEAYGGYTDGTPFTPGFSAYHRQLRAKEYLALGDNSANSSDGRTWGPVPEQNLVGPALLVYWPFEHWGLIR